MELVVAQTGLKIASNVHDSPGASTGGTPGAVHAPRPKLNPLQSPEGVQPEETTSANIRGFDGPVPSFLKVNIWVLRMPLAAVPKSKLYTFSPNTPVPISVPGLSVRSGAEAALLVPSSVMLAFACTPVAVRVALSLSALLVGAYWTVMLHDFFGPRLLSVHWSLVIENVEPGNVTLNEPEPLPPALVSLNVSDFVSPASSVP